MGTTSGCALGKGAAALSERITSSGGSLNDDFTPPPVPVPVPEPEPEPEPLLLLPLGGLSRIEPAAGVASGGKLPCAGEDCGEGGCSDEGGGGGDADGSRIGARAELRLWLDRCTRRPANAALPVIGPNPTLPEAEGEDAAASLDPGRDELDDDEDDPCCCCCWSCCCAAA